MSNNLTKGNNMKLQVSSSIEEAQEKERIYKIQHVIDMMSRYFSNFPIPYEQVVYGDKVIGRRIEGRIYKTSYYRIDDQILKYEDLVKLRGPLFRGTYNEEEISIVEVFSDYGSDGHTEYSLIGYTLLPSKSQDCTDLLNGTYFNRGRYA